MSAMAAAAMTATHEAGSHGKIVPFDWPLQCQTDDDVPSAGAFVFDVSGSQLDSQCCVDGGASHHIGTRMFFNDHPDWFTVVDDTTAESLPTSVQCLFGRDKVWKIATFHPPWPAWEGLIVSPMLITKNGTAKLISERQLVLDNQCTVTHSPAGKWLTLTSGDTIDLSPRSGVHWMPGSLSTTGRGCSATTSTEDSTMANTWISSYNELCKYWYQSKCPEAGDAMVNTLADFRSQETVEAVNFAATHGLSRGYKWATSVLAFRSPRQVCQCARRQGISPTNRDETYIEAALQGRGKVKPDPAQLRTQRNPRELWAQDPVTYKTPLYRGITSIYFTLGVGTGRVRAFPSRSKNTTNAIKAIEEYGRHSRSWVNREHDGPQLLQTDDDTIYKSTEYMNFLRAESIVERHSAPYCHKQNTQIEKPIGIIHGSALSMTHAVLCTDSTRRPVEFFILQYPTNVTLTPCFLLVETILQIALSLLSNWLLE
jgi:hypothetical protein